MDGHTEYEQQLDVIEMIESEMNKAKKLVRHNAYKKEESLDIVEAIESELNKTKKEKRSLEKEIARVRSRSGSSERQV